MQKLQNAHQLTHITDFSNLQNQVKQILIIYLFFLYNILSGMRIEFVMKVDEVEIKVEAVSFISYYAGLPHMQEVGYFYFYDVDSGQSLGSASRHYQDCDEIVLIAQTRDQIDIAEAALSWLQQNDFGAWELMNWNTHSIGRPRDFERHQESESKEQQEQYQKIDESQQQSAKVYEGNPLIGDKQINSDIQSNKGLFNKQISPSDNRKEE